MFEEFGKKLSAYGQVIYEGSQNITESNSLKWQIESRERMNNDDFLLLGKKLYAEMKDVAVELNPDIVRRLDHRLSEIESLKASLEQKNKEMSSIKGKWICNECNNENSKDSMFCSSCGSKRPEGVTEKRIQYSKDRCPSCNNVLLEGAMFCTNCGFRIQVD